MTGVQTCALPIWLSPRFPAEQDVAAGAAARAPAAGGRARRHLSPGSRRLPRALPGPGPRPPPRSVWAAASALRAGTRATRLARAPAAAGCVRERSRPPSPRRSVFSSRHLRRSRFPETTPSPHVGSCFLLSVHSTCYSGFNPFSTLWYNSFLVYTQNISPDRKSTRLNSSH